MTLRTLMTMLRGGQLRLLRALLRESDHYYRLAFLGAGLSSGVLPRLAAGTAN